MEVENILSRVDENGRSTTMLKGIIYYRKDENTAVPKSEKYINTRSGQQRIQKTMEGWKLLVEWADRTESWINLKDLKESHPVDVAEFSKARNIADKAAFAWWVPYTIQIRMLLSALCVVVPERRPTSMG